MRRDLLVALLVAVSPALALANGYNVPNVNARDLALVDSARASQHTAAAVYANPAALAGLEGLNLSLGLSVLDLRTEWKGPAEPEATNAGIPRATNRSVASIRFKPVPPPAIFVAYGGKAGEHGWGVGGGLNIIAGGNVFWPDNWTGRYRIITVDRKVWGFYLTGGFEVVKQLKVGGGLVYYRTTEELIQAIDFVTSDGRATLAASGGAVSYDLSALITPVPGFPLTLAVDYKHQGVQKLTGNAHFSNVPPSLSTSPLLQDQGVTHMLTVPNVLNFGLAFQATPKLLLTAGFTWDRYEVYQEDVFQGDLGASVVVNRFYDNGHTFRLGAEYAVTPQLTLRGGLLRDISGLKTSTLSPTLPDSDVWGGALGGGYAFTPDLGVDFTAWYAHFDEVTATETGPSPKAFPGTYQSQAVILAVALVVRDPLGLFR